MWVAQLALAKSIAGNQNIRVSAKQMAGGLQGMLAKNALLSQISMTALLDFTEINAASLRTMC